MRERLTTIWQERPEWARNTTVIALTGTLVALLVTFALALGYLGSDRPGKEISLSDLSALADQGRVDRAEFRDPDAVIVAHARAGAGAGTVPSAEGTYSVNYPTDGTVTQGLIDELRKAGADVRVERQDFKAAVQTVTTFLLPLMILANLFALAFLLMRSSSSALTDIEKIGRAHV